MSRLLRPVRPIAILLVAGALLGASVFSFAAVDPVPPASASPTTAPASADPLDLIPPDLATLRAYDRPSDDGSAIIVEWAKPKSQPYRAWYVIEMAESEEAFAAKDKPTTNPTTRPTTKPKGKAKDTLKVYTWKVDPGDGALKSANPKFFGFSGKNKTLYFASIPPAVAIKGAGAGPLTIERVGALVDSGRLDDKTARQAMTILRTKQPKDRKPTDKEKQMRSWAERLRAHLGLAGILDLFVFGGVLTPQDATAVIAILKNTKPDDKLSEAEAADRKWLGRLKSLAPVGMALGDLRAAKVLSADDAKRLVAAYRNRKIDQGLTDEEKLDRKWLTYLKSYAPLAMQLSRLQADEYLRAEDVDRALDVLTLRKPEDDWSDQDKADRQWLLRLKGAAKVIGILGRLVEKKILTEAEVQHVAAYVQDHAKDKDLSDASKATQAWLERAAGWVSLLLEPEEIPGKGPLKPYTEAGLLQAYVEQGLIEAPQIERIVRALRDVTADDTVTGQAQADRFWLARIRAFLQKKTQENKKAKRQDENRKTWRFRVAVTDGTRTQYATSDGAPMVVSASARPNVFSWFKLNNLIFALLFSAVVLVFIQVAKRNPNLFIRKITGLEAVEEAIGRATEMGRAVYFVHGLGAMGGLSTIAAVTVLGRVARRAAEYDTRIQVMNRDPIVTAVSQEVVKQGYMEAGRPDAYDADDVALVAYDQFSYVAAVAGRMVRERPAAIFLIGSFFAESLLLAETGASTGAIQVAGTDSFAQLPFFITTCDYTLIGEELYAASAYLSREPKMLGSLRGQDVGKAFMMLVMIASAVITTIAAAAAANADWLRNLFQAF